MKYFYITFYYLLILFSKTASAQKFISSSEKPPVGYEGKVFQLSQDYPVQLKVEKDLPWSKIDFRKEPLKYVESVYHYVLEGNLECDWKVQNNKIRKWYHVPWMHWNDPKDGLLSREFINGLTRERDSRPYELSPQQYGFVQNWAVGIYNPAGGYTIGEVWKDAENPDPSKSNFPIGTVCGKLLFTEADTNYVPYLIGSPVWMANIHVSVNDKTKKTIKPLRLLQFDIAVRDDRADNESGWVFGTLVYDGTVQSTNPWQRMIPAGAHWGIDPGITPDDIKNGEKLKESFINPIVRSKYKYGWAGRLNGPVDDPNSSCVSCHSTAEYPMRSFSAPSENASTSERLIWFRKTIKTGKAFTSGAKSLQYSLQLARGIERFYMYKSQNSGKSNSVKWKERLLLFARDGYALILAIVLLVFFLISKNTKESLLIQPLFSFDHILLFLRIGIGLMLMVHGFGKITGGSAAWLKLGQTMANLNIYFFPQWWGFLAAFAEFGGGLMLLCGLFFRPVIFMLIIHFSIACLKHYKGNDSIEAASHAIELLVVMIILFLTGPGFFTFDRKISVYLKNRH